MYQQIRAVLVQDQLVLSSVTYPIKLPLAIAK